MAKAEQADAPADQAHELGGVVDPMVSVLARPPMSLDLAVVPPPVLLPSQLLDQLAARIVRRCSVGHDGDTSTIRLELGEGRFEGASVLVQSERGKLSVRILGAQPEQRRVLEGALRTRLAARGVAEADVTAE